MHRKFDQGPSKQVNDVTSIRRPTVEGWEPQHLLMDLLELRDLAFQRQMYGPFDVLLAPAWDPHINARWRITPLRWESEEQRLAEMQRVEDVVARATDTPSRDMRNLPAGDEVRDSISLKERLLQVEGFAELRLDPTLQGYDAALVSLVEHAGARVGDVVRAES